MKLALAQMKMSKVPGDNIQKAFSLIEEAAALGADLILFPALQTSRFFTQYPSMDVKDLSFSIEDKFICDLCAACKRNRIMAVPNICLRENGMNFCGESIVSDANGNVLKKADSTEQILYCDVSLDSSKSTRKRKPYTTLRKTEWYL